MDDRNFLSTIYELAESLMGRPLTTNEKNKLIEEFNNSSGSNYQRAKIAIEICTGKNIPDLFRSLERAGSINNLEVKVADMKAAAEKWKKNGKNSD